MEPPEIVTREDWERCSPWLEGALRYSHGTHILSDVLADIEANRATFWPFEKSVVVTQLTNWPRLTSLTFWLAGGDMRDMLAQEPGIVDWGRRQGATHFVVIGRKGWQRVMQTLGYRPHHYTTFKDITDGQQK